MEERARERMNRKKALEEKKRKAEEEKLVREAVIFWLFIISKKFAENEIQLESKWNSSFWFFPKENFWQ